MEALGHCGGKVLDFILSVPSNQLWAVLKTTLILTYSEFKFAAHSCSHLDNVRMMKTLEFTSGTTPGLKRWLQMRTWTPSRWTWFLTNINNTTISDKVLRSKTFPRNLEEAMKKAIQLEAGFQLSEGVNVACRINMMQAEVNEVDTLKDPPSPVQPLLWMW